MCPVKYPICYDFNYCTRRSDFSPHTPCTPSSVVSKTPSTTPPATPSLRNHPVTSTRGAKLSGRQNLPANFLGKTIRPIGRTTSPPPPRFSGANRHRTLALRRPTRLQHREQAHHTVRSSPRQGNLCPHLCYLTRPPSIPQPRPTARCAAFQSPIEIENLWISPPTASIRAPSTLSMTYYLRSDSPLVKIQR